MKRFIQADLFGDPEPEQDRAFYAVLIAREPEAGGDFLLKVEGLVTPDGSLDWRCWCGSGGIASRDEWSNWADRADRFEAADAMYEPRIAS